MKYQLQHIDLLWLFFLVPAAVLLFLWIGHWRKNTRKKIGNKILVQQLFKSYAPGRELFKACCILLAIVAGVVAVLNLRKPKENTLKVANTGIDILIALDVSNSMLATDASPDRISLAKQFIHSLIDAQPGCRFGLVIFAGNAYLQMPITNDGAAAKMFVETANPAEIINQGTTLSGAIKLGSESFDNHDTTIKTIVLITDGEGHDTDALEIAAQLAKQGVIVHTIGIGTAAGSAIVDTKTKEPKKDAAGNIIYSKLNEEILTQIAAATNGAYINLLQNDKPLKTLSQYISKTKSHPYLHPSQIQYATLYPLFAGLMLLFLVVEMFISNKKTRPLMKYASLLFFTLVQFIAAAQVENKFFDLGNELFKQNKYAEAEAAYKKALNGWSKQGETQYNLALTLYKQQKKAQAIVLLKQFIASANDGALKSKAYYNIGVMFTNNDMADASIEAYKNALRLNPNDVEARENLQKALAQSKKNNRQEQSQTKKSSSNKNENKNPQPQPQQQQPNNKLKQLQQKEKELMKRIQNKQSPKITTGGAKDW